MFESWEPLYLPKALTGGGGTSFKAPFEWIEREQMHPDLVVYFTDAEGEFPAREPHCIRFTTWARQPWVACCRALRFRLRALLLPVPVP